MPDHDGGREGGVGGVHGTLDGIHRPSVLI
jgi:hypothetical protein